MRSDWIRKAEKRLADAEASLLVQAPVSSSLSIADGYATEDAADAKKAEEKAAHDEEHMALNHRSASAMNSSDLRQQILSELRRRTLTLNRLGRVEWEGTFDVLVSVEAWIRYGKPVVDATLAEMDGKDVDLADVSQKGFPQSIRLR
jgi:hypothetical protein